MNALFITFVYDKKTYLFFLRMIIIQDFNPISTGLFYLVVALGGGGPPPSIKFDPDILKH